MWGAEPKKGSSCANKRYWTGKECRVGEEEVELEAERLCFAALT